MVLPGRLEGLGRHRRTGLVETTSPVFVQAETQEQLVSSDGPWRGTPRSQYQQLSALQLLMSMANADDGNNAGDHRRQRPLMPRLASNSQPTTGARLKIGIKNCESTQPGSVLLAIRAQDDAP